MVAVVSPRRPLAVRIAKRLAHREAPSGFAAALAWAALSVSVLAPVCVATPIGWPAKFVIVLAFACVAPGSAIVSYVQLGDEVAAATVALILSLATSAAVAVTMVWTKAWHPLAGLILLAVLSAMVAAIRLLPRFVVQPSPDRLDAIGPADPTGSEPGPAGPGTGRPDVRVAPNSALPATSARSATVTAVLTATRSANPANSPAAPRAREHSDDETSVIPAIRDTASDETAVIPAFRDPEADETRVIPAFRERQADETRVIPAVREPVADETAVIAAIPDSAADNTAIIPVVRHGDNDQTAVFAAIRSDATAQRATARPVRVGPSYLAIHICLILGAMGMWIYGLTQSSTANVGDYGLLSVMNPAFYTALGACVVGFVAALTSKRLIPAVLIGYIVLLVLIMHATVPALLSTPEYAWTLRHVGVIEFIRSLGGVNDPLDIYQEWPTFFALVAQLASVSGAHTLTVAGWAPVFFDLAACLPLFAIARTLSNDPRLPYLSVFTFTAINWVAQDYLSPQAFAFLLCLGILMVMLRWLRRMPGARVRVWPKSLGRLWNWLQDGLVEVPYTSKGARRLALAVLYFVYAAVVASHQLSPYLIAASAVSLVALGLIRPVRIVPILLGIAVAYVVPRYQVVDNYGIFDGLNFLRNASGVGPQGVATVTAGRAFSVKVVETLALSTWALTATILFSARRRLGPLALPGVLAFAPFVMLVAQSYGGEAIYRVFLFSSPWCAYLLAHQALAMARWARSAHALRLTRIAQFAIGAPLLIVMVLASIQGAHGQLSFDQFTSGEVRGEQYLYASAPIGSDIVYASSNYPGKLTSRYGAIVSGKLNELTLLQIGPYSDITTTGVPDLDAIDAYFSTLDSPVRYLVFSKSMIEYAHYFGYLPDNTLQTMSAEVSTSPSFQVWYHDNGIVIFKYIGAASPG